MKKNKTKEEGEEEVFYLCQGKEKQAIGKGAVDVHSHKYWTSPICIWEFLVLLILDFYSTFKTDMHFTYI